MLLLTNSINLITVLAFSEWYLQVIKTKPYFIETTIQSKFSLWFDKSFPPACKKPV